MLTKGDSQLQSIIPNSHLIIASIFVACSLIPLMTINLINKKVMFIIGSASMSISLGLIGILVKENLAYDEIFFLIFFIFAFTNTWGPLTYIYLSEVLVDSALCLCFFGLFLS